MDGDHVVERGDPFEVLGGDRAGRDPGGAELGPEPGLLHHPEVDGVLEQDLDPLGPVQPSSVVLALTEGGLPQCVHARDQRFIELRARHPPPRSRRRMAFIMGPGKSTVNQYSALFALPEGAVHLRRVVPYAN
ncbi:hypothetical protein [Kitasatospora purpeofusca]|uniref:Uncharacterized protein n=1 Tax=Kitasatospora purpeofusca TaxID=67352 RepID=A0ABZ1UAL4_9ACTN|nr:hypothetical protein [Kitasatospora purpeofusca]